MSEQPLDIRRSWGIVRRHRIVVAAVALLGLLAGAAYTVLRPPMLSSSALVVLPTSAQEMPTQVVIAGSNPVLLKARDDIDPSMSLRTLNNRVQVRSLTFNVLSISGEGKTAAEAERTANAVTDSYVSYVNSPVRAGGHAQARVLETATEATGMSFTTSMLITAGLGLLAGTLLGAIIALAIGRGRNRLRERDAMADAVGVPVLASVSVRRPAGAPGWRKLLENYAPDAAEAWRMRKALHYLGLAHVRGSPALSLAVVSLATDRKALALGPQFAVYAASQGIPTLLLVSDQPDLDVMRPLHAVCAAPWMRSGNLRVGVIGHAQPDKDPGPVLTVIVAVVDEHGPARIGSPAAGVTVLGASAGAETAEQLVSIAIACAAQGHEITGLLVADPDPRDQTTGRFPQLGRPTHRQAPTRMTGTATESRL